MELSKILCSAVSKVFVLIAREWEKYSEVSNVLQVARSKGGVPLGPFSVQLGPVHVPLSPFSVSLGHIASDHRTVVA